MELQTVQQILRQKWFEFSNDYKKPNGLDEDSSDSNGDEQESTQQQPKLLRWSDKVSMTPTRYG